VFWDCKECRDTVVCTVCSYRSRCFVEGLKWVESVHAWNSFEGDYENYYLLWCGSVYWLDIKFWTETSVCVCVCLCVSIFTVEVMDCNTSAVILLYRNSLFNVIIILCKCVSKMRFSNYRTSHIQSRIIINENPSVVSLSPTSQFCTSLNDSISRNYLTGHWKFHQSRSRAGVLPQKINLRWGLYPSHVNTLLSLSKFASSTLYIRNPIATLKERYEPLIA
jgi:hypothetical protein